LQPEAGAEVRGKKYFFRVAGGTCFSKRCDSATRGECRLVHLLNRDAMARFYPYEILSATFWALPAVQEPAPPAGTGLVGLRAPHDCIGVGPAEAAVPAGSVPDGCAWTGRLVSISIPSRSSDTAKSAPAAVNKLESPAWSRQKARPRPFQPESSAHRA